MRRVEKFKVIISDCHLSAGRFFEGRLNPHEDFLFDEEMADLFKYFSTGKYGERDGKPVEVELIIAGDFFDFLNVPYQGEFEEAITESISLYKLESMIRAHARVMAGLRRFAALPGKKITYLVGNHDADLFFTRVRERIIREWDPQGEYPSQKVHIEIKKDRLAFEGGVEIHHGNQFEPGSYLNFEKPLLTEHLPEPVLNLPWSSFYVLKIINRLKWDRDWVDKVRPVKVFLVLGLFMDTLFTLRFMFLSAFYFAMTRFVWSPARRSRFKLTLEMLKPELRLFLDLEREARALLNTREDVKTIIFGHTHRPMNRIYPDGKQYINIGTWTKMINLDFKGLGQQVARTFVLVRIENNTAFSELRQWIGEHSPHHTFDG